MQGKNYFSAVEMTVDSSLVKYLNSGSISKKLTG